MPERALWICAFSNSLIKSAFRNKPLFVFVQIQTIIAIDDAGASEPMLAHFMLHGTELRDDVSFRALVSIAAAT